MTFSDSMESSVLMFQGCPEEHLLELFDRGEVSETLINPVSDHVGGCKKCQQKIESFRPDFFESSLVAAFGLNRGKTESDLAREDLGHKESVIDEIIEKFRQEVPELEVTESKKTNRFELSKFIGSGQFGEVHMAYDHHQREAVALKITAEDVTYNENQLNTFLADVQRISQLQHPNIVPILDQGCWSGHRAFFTMPLIDGVSFTKWLGAPKSRPVRTSLKFFHSIMDTVEFLHQQGLLHRNLKPSNIFITRSNQLSLTDVGLFLDERYLQGRPEYDPEYFVYNPPEQLQFESHRMAASSDIFSLGRILQLILNRSRANREEKLASYLRPLAKIAKKCTQTLQSERFQSITQLRDEMKACDY